MNFDPSERYLVGYGGLNLFIFNLQTGTQYQYRVKESLYDKINFASIRLEGEVVQCQVACKEKNLNVISLFDILQNHDQVKELVLRF